MSLGKKAIGLFSLLGLCFCVGGYAVQKSTVYPAFESFERQAAQETVSRVLDALDAELHALEVMNTEYSVWTDTWNYVRGDSPDYPEENLDPIYWAAIDIQMFLIFGPEGEQVFGFISDPEDGSMLSLAEELGVSLGKDHVIIRHDSPDSGVRGYLRTSRGLMRVISKPILKTDGSGGVAGSLVLGQYLTPELLNSLGRRVTADLAISFPFGNLDAPGSASAAEGMPELTSDSPSFTFDDDAVRGYQLISDVHGAPAAVVEITTPRTVASIGKATINSATLLLAAASILFIATVWFLSQRAIIGPIKSLTDQILRIRETGRLEFTAYAGRTDEVGLLAEEFAGLTEELQEVQRDLEEARDTAVVMSQMKSEFLARMSHEIRTPMNGVLGMTELLRDTQLDEKQERIAQTINDSATSLLHIINDILDFSKIEAGKVQLELTDVDLRSIIEDTAEAFAGQAHRKGVELMHIVDPELDTMVVADPVRLRQVLTNLIGNAIKFTEKGEVVVRVSCSPASEGSLSVRFDVVDTGIGIHPEKQKLIFESFMQEDGTTTRLYGGTGLGLAISKQLVDLMGGELLLDSVPDEGSTFSFTLPLEKSQRIETGVSAAVRFISGTRVLIVDDNATNREILDHQLTRWKASPVAVDSAESALAELDASLERGERYDLAILDMHMPQVDGLELARRIRANNDLAELKLVILSSIADPTSETCMRDLDIAAQLTKPIQQASLYRSLVAIISGENETLGVTRRKSADAQLLSGRVLLAEDNPVNQAVALGMLESLGLDVEIAEDGAAATEKAGAGGFDAILMDCQMPVKDGFEATRAIREKEASSASPQVPIIAVTANALKGDRQNCLDAGMDDYLSKPFTREQLHAVLGPLLVRGSAHPPERQKPDGCMGAANDAGNESGVLDEAVLDALSQLQKTDAPSLVGKVIAAYLESSGDIKLRLIEAIDAGDAQAITTNAHALKSSSGNVGATSLAELARQLEFMGRNDEIGDASRLRDSVEREYDRVVAALEEKRFGAAA